MLEWMNQNRWLFDGVGGAMILALIGVLWKYITDRNKRRDVGKSGNIQAASVLTFSAPEIEKYNYDFYSYFIKKIKNAKNDIYITGDGFECADDEGTELSRRFNSAFFEALNKGVHVVRVQTRSNTHEKWAKQLSDLKSKFSNFDLYVTKSGTIAQMSSICVIDHEDDKDCVVEIMLSTQKLFGVKAAELAGTAIFIEGTPKLSRDMRDRILSLTNSSISTHLNNAEDTEKWLAGTVLIFAYGSNMSKKQMLKRTPSAEFISVGMIDNYKLVFNREGSYRKGGVASIEYQDDGRVYGGIWKISANELDLMDKAEDPEAYTREIISIKGLDDIDYECEVYISHKQGEFIPSTAYLELIISSAKELKLPYEYVNKLEALESKQYSP